MDLICKSSRGISILSELPAPRGLPIPRNLPNPRGFPILRNLLKPGLDKIVPRSGGCSSGYTITLDAIGNEHKPDTAGDYLEVCSADGISVYRYYT